MFAVPVTTLAEFESCEIALQPDAYSLLVRRYAGRVNVELTEQPGVYRVTARDYVGRIALPGIVLVIQPKVKVSSLFFMLCADAGLLELRGPTVAVMETGDIYTVVLQALVESAERLLARGLYREYFSVTGDLPLVRGRIQIATQVTHHADLKHRHICAYTELTADTAENRVLLASLRHVPMLLGGQNRSLARRARSCAARLDGVRVLPVKAAQAVLAHLEVHRLNSDYWPLLGLCRLALSHLTLEAQAGEQPFSSFLVNMPRLFESFLTVRLREALPDYRLRVVAQRHDYLDEGRQVGIRPDVLVYGSDGDDALLVIDAKYRRLGEPGEDLNSDLYQISAYLDRYELKRGLLVYPQFHGRVIEELRLRGTGKRLHVATLDLSSGVQQLEKSSSELSAEVAALASGPAR